MIRAAIALFEAEGRLVVSTAGLNFSSSKKYLEAHTLANKALNFWLNRELSNNSKAGGKESTSARARIPSRLAQPTFIEARSAATAISDGRDLRNWSEIEGVVAMLHAPKNTDLQTRFEPCSMLLGWWGSPDGARIETLRNELRHLDLDALATFFVCLSWAIEEYQVTASLDSIITAIGRDSEVRSSSANRELWRNKVWRWMLLFDSLAVIGTRPGIWREPRSGDKRREKIPSTQLHSKDALLKIIGLREEEQLSLDSSTPPKEITFAAGPWVNRFRGNREVLSHFGELRVLANIPRGKPSGAWAVCIGLMLHQRWREQAAKAHPIGVGEDITQHFRPFTRHSLLCEMWRSDFDVDEILSSDKPSRAKKYWDQAIRILHDEGVIGFCQPLGPITNSRQGWQREWLEQPLDIQPGLNSRQDALSIHKAATSARSRRRAQKPKK